MPRRIPIEDAKRVADRFPDVKQVILLAWDGRLTHVVTYGRTVDDCDQAAQGGDRVKAALGWPESLNAMPSRVKALKKRVAELEAALAERGEREE